MSMVVGDEGHRDKESFRNGAMLSQRKIMNGTT